MKSAIFLSVALALFSFAPISAQPQPAREFLVYVGTYTGPKSQGIYAFRLDAQGKLSPLGLAAESANPSFLAIHPSEPFLYAVNEIGNFEGERAGSVSAFAIDRATGKLRALNRESSVGAGPCHIVTDKEGKHVLVANYGGGSIAVLPVQRDGKLGRAVAFNQHEGSSVNPQRQRAPHAHSINLDPANRFAFVADLGLDKVLVYRFAPADGKLPPNQPAFAPVAPGAGPRHFTFLPNGNFAYVINELHCTVTAFRYDASRGGLQEIQTITTLPSGQEVASGFSTAEIVAHPSGKFIYGSNRGHDTIAVFSVDVSSGKLTPVQHQSTLGRTPRNFAIDPTGNFLIAANQNSDSLAVFRIDAQTGKLTPVGEPVEGIGAPVCVRFVAVGRD